MSSNPTRDITLCDLQSIALSLRVICKVLHDTGGPFEMRELSLKKNNISCFELLPLSYICLYWFSYTYLVCTSTSCNIFFNLKVRCCFGSAASSPLNLVAAGLVVTQVPASVSLYETNRKLGRDNCWSTK